MSTAAPPNSVRAEFLTPICGAAVWVTFCLLVRPGLIAATLLFATLVVIPLGCNLLRRLPCESGRSVLQRWFRRFVPPAALLLCVSFLLPASGPAAALAGPWFSVTLLATAHGLHILAAGVWRTPAGWCRAAGCLLVAVGGVWTVLARWGSRPLGFSEEIVLLTGVHFHFAGFALPIIVARVVGAVRGWLAWPLAAAVVLGVPLVGLGITVTQVYSAAGLELTATLLLSAACWILAALQARTSLRSRRPWTMVLHLAASLSLATAMVLAVVYAWGRCFSGIGLEIPLMAATHGLLNAFGFCLLSLLACLLEPPAAPLDQRAVRP